MNHREFIDKDRTVGLAYYDLLDQASSMEVNDFVESLNNLMKADPCFMDTHLLMIEILKENGEAKKARRLLDECFERAIELIIDEEGNWPEKIPWGFLENRHIIRIIFNKATALWDQEQTEPALKLFRKLLRTNPNDNIGARQYILAIRMGMSLNKFEKRFDKGGYYDEELITWFDKNAGKYPDEFGWWFDLIEKQ